jgi:hypothetical protein
MDYDRRRPPTAITALERRVIRAHLTGLVQVDDTAAAAITPQFGNET